MSRPTPSATDEAQVVALGRELAEALAVQDPDRLRALFARPVRFTAVTPRRFWEADNAPAIVDDIMLGPWFGPGTKVVALEGLEASALGPLGRFSYRLRVETETGPATVEQAGYLRATGGQVAELRLVCSGFLPD